MKWDNTNTEKKCIKCNGVLEDQVCGDTSGIYAYTSDPAVPVTSCSLGGNKKCESACGADAACDEVAPGTNGCDASCRKQDTCTPAGGTCVGSYPCNTGYSPDSTKSCTNGVCCMPTGCTAGATQECTTANGDKGTQTCSASGTWGGCVASCTKNADCGLNRCCIAHQAPPEASGPDSTRTTCQDKGPYNPNPAYLCDPGTWMKCDENSVGNKAEFDSKTFMCTKENSAYKWVEATPSNGLLKNILGGILSFFTVLFL